MPAQPPANPRRRRASLAAVARRMADTPAGGGPRIIGQSQQPTTRGGPRVTSQSAQPTTGYGAIQPRAQAMAERIASQRSSSMQRKAPPRTLGHATHQSEVFTGRTGENPNTPRTAFGHEMHPGSRAGKKFKIGFTPEGRIVHLYGADVAPGERRVVLPQRDTGLKLMSAAQRRARRRA